MADSRRNGVRQTTKAGNSVSTVISRRICIDVLRLAWLGKFDAGVWTACFAANSRGLAAMIEKPARKRRLINRTLAASPARKSL